MIIYIYIFDTSFKNMMKRIVSRVFREIESPSLIKHIVCFLFILQWEAKLNLRKRNGEIERAHTLSLI